MADINRIISMIDHYLEVKGLDRVESNEASRYLEKNGVLNYSTKGQPLRKLLRDGKIPNAEQPGGKRTAWYIRHSGAKKTRTDYNHMSKVPSPVEAQVSGKVLTDGLAPVEDPESEILILGTLPGKVSLMTRQYYANGSNQFWKIISDIYGEVLPYDYSGKIEFLRNHHIALWDVLQSADRNSSLDSDIKDPVVNDVIGFISNHPKLRIIGLNGEKAYNYLKSGVGLYKIPANVRVVVLPSTSAANTHMTMSEKISHWKKILLK